MIGILPSFPSKRDEVPGSTLKAECEDYLRAQKHTNQTTSCPWLQNSPLANSNSSGSFNRAIFRSALSMGKRKEKERGWVSVSIVPSSSALRSFVKADFSCSDAFLSLETFCSRFSTFSREDKTKITQSQYRMI